MSAEDLYQSGKLAGALEAGLAQVKSNPLDRNARFFLSELMCFSGEWERADRQLDSVVQQADDSAMLALLLRQLIRGEVIREQVFTEGRPPELVVPLTDDAKLQLELVAALRLGQTDDAASLTSRGEEARTVSTGTADERSFTGIQDMDDRLRGVLEVITASGKYFWVPWKNVRSLEFSAPERPMDLIWRKTLIDVIDGPEGEVYVPVRYPVPTGAGWDDALKLGRATDWSGDESTAVTGLGQRMLLLGEDAVSIMELKNLQIDEAEVTASDTSGDVGQ